MPRRGIDKQTILREAIAIISDKGLEALSLAELAKQLGIKSPSLYNHVDGLQDLKKQLALFGFSKLNDSLTEASVGKAGDEAIQQLAFAYVTFVRENKGLYLATMPEFYSHDYEVHNAGEQIVNLLNKVLEFYHLNEDEKVHVIRGLRSICHGFASLEQMEGFNLSSNKNESFTHLIQTYLKGFTSRYSFSENK